MKLFLYMILLFFINVVNAQYDIKISIKNYPYDYIVVSAVTGEKPEPIDTVKKSESNFFLFKGEHNLEDGVYYIGYKARLDKFKMIVSENDCHFEAYYDFKNTNKFSFKNSEENRVYEEYFMRSLQNRNLANLYLRNRKFQKRDSLLVKLNALRDTYIKNNRNSVVSLVISSEKDWIGEKKISKIEDNNFKIMHFLDDIDLNNPISNRIPGAHNKLKEYFNKVVVTRPDSINSSIKKVFDKIGGNKILFKHYLKYLLDKYRKSFDYWVDDSYVFLANNYVNKREAPWMTQKEIDYIKYKSERKEKTLIGKIIPDVTLKTENEEKVKLLDIESDFTVLIFWRPGCSHCRHAMPFLNKVNEKYRKQGVKIVSICTRQRSDTYRCWDGVKSEGMEDFAYNLADKDGTTGFLREFNIGGIPMIFILDKNHRIIRKKVKAQKLMSTLEELLD